MVPVNPASAPPEIAYLLEDSGAAVFAFDPAAVAAVTVALEAGVTDAVTEADDALILYTSGTTGLPKGRCSTTTG